MFFGCFDFKNFKLQDKNSIMNNFQENVKPPSNEIEPNGSSNCQENIQHDSIPQQPTSAPEKYFDLITIVGAKGKYQKIAMIIYCFVWYLTGNILLGTPFLFYIPQYQCKGNLSNEQCISYICSLEPLQKKTYLDTKDFISSLGTEQGVDYNCESSMAFQFAKSAVYVGSLIGYVFVSPLVDNIGRKSSIVICLILSFLGLVLIWSSHSLNQAIFGMIIAGIGLDSAVQTTFYVIAETVAEQYRQKWSVLIQSFFCIGGLGSVIYYYFLRNWREVFIIYCVTAFVGLLAVFIYTEQTPSFLIKKYDNQTVAKRLNRIGKINTQQPDLIKIEHIEHVRHSNHHDSTNKKYISPISLINTAIMRKLIFCYCVLLSVVYFLYYGPLMMIQNFGLNVFVNATVLESSQFVTFLPMYFLVQKLPRKKTGIVLFSVIAMCSVILIFLKHKSCENLCRQNVLQLIVFFVFRFCGSFEFSILLIYGYQLLPAQVRGMGNGAANAFGTVVSSLSPVIVSLIGRTQFPIASLFLITAIMSIIISSLLGETKGLPLKEQIQQLLAQNKQSDERNGQIQLVQENFQEQK